MRYVFFILMLLVVLRGLLWADNEWQSPFDKKFLNREKWGPMPNEIVSEQEVDSVQFKASA